MAVDPPCERLQRARDPVGDRRVEPTLRDHRDRAAGRAGGGEAQEQPVPLLGPGDDDVGPPHHGDEPHEGEGHGVAGAGAGGGEERGRQRRVGVDEGTVVGVLDHRELHRDAGGARPPAGVVERDAQTPVVAQ